MSQYKKKILVVLSLITLVGVSIATKPGSEGLELPTCETKESINTRVHFFIDKEVLENATLDGVHAFLDNSIEYANRVLINSCIPMTRSKGEVVVVDIDKTQVYDIHTARKFVKTTLQQAGVIENRPKPGEFYGLVYDKRHEKHLNVSGLAYSYFGGWFFALSSGALDLVLEHELGHLAWAQHTETHPTPNLTLYLKSMVPEDYHPFLAPYARAVKCGDSGTIMSYELNILPVYSSPDVRYQGKTCGDAEAGDNARVVREYAERLKETLTAH